MSEPDGLQLMSIKYELNTFSIVSVYVFVTFYKSIFFLIYCGPDIQEKMQVSVMSNWQLFFRLKTIIYNTRERDSYIMLYQK